MTVVHSLVLLVAGLLAGMLIPRLPMLFFTRFLGLEGGLRPHPDPVPVDVPLIHRMRRMRRVHLMGWILAMLPLAFGIAVLRMAPEPFAFGLVGGVAWFAIGRLVPMDIEDGWGVMPMATVYRLNELRRIDPPCCGRPFPQWEVQAVRCRHCRLVLLDQPRPDLGRIRSDGRLIGAFRVLLADGRPFVGCLEGGEFGLEVVEEE